MKDKNKAPRTIEYALAVVRQVFNEASDWGYIQNQILFQR